MYPTAFFLLREKTSGSHDLTIYPVQGETRRNCRTLQSLDDAIRRLAQQTYRRNKDGYEIIRKLQSDLKTVKSKIKLKNVVTLQQKKLLDERMAVLEEVKAENEMAKKEKEGLRGDSNSLKNEKKALETKLEEGKKIIEVNNQTPARILELFAESARVTVLLSPVILVSSLLMVQNSTSKDRVITT